MAVTVNSIAQLIEKKAPKSWAEEWDNVGLLVGDGAAKVDKILVTLDGTLEVIEEAIELGAQLIVAHHPILFRPLKNLRFDNAAAQIPIKLLKHGIAYYAAHTNLDKSGFSSSWAFGYLLGLKDVEILAPVAEESLVKLAVFVPEKDVEKVRLALAQSGVGENPAAGSQSTFYSEVFYQSAGEGMFKPFPGANPTVGRIGELTRVKEVKLESILPAKLVERAVKALIKVHPYEEPAYDLIPLQNSGQTRGYGILGYLSQVQDLESFSQYFLELLGNSMNNGNLSSPVTVSNSLSTGAVDDSGRPVVDRQTLFAANYSLAGLRWAGEPSKQIRKVAIVNGSGGGFLPKALAKGADILIAGDIDHHQVLDALQGNMAVADIGHFLSEAPMLSTLSAYLREEKTLKGVEIYISNRNTVPWRRSVNSENSLQKNISQR